MTHRIHGMSCNFTSICCGVFSQNPQLPASVLGPRILKYMVIQLFSLTPRLHRIYCILANSVNKYVTSNSKTEVEKWIISYWS